jgi:SAM-dependent methyltransferase
MLLYASAIFLSAFLLFEVQPIIARFVLPWFGGSAAVWTTCMLFFQAALVLGYLQGFATHRWLKPRQQAWLHLALLAGSLLLLPIVPAPSWKPLGTEEPIGRILALLLRCVGLPYVLLATTGPLFQSWFVRQYPGRNPYRLYALSNLASMLALLGYPLIVEPLWSSPQQARGWSWGYACFAALGGAVALRTALAREPAAAVAPATSAPESLGDYPSPRWHTYLFWLLLPACASTLLLAITNHLTQDVAAIPLLWILPLCLYLLTFILCFEYPHLYRRRLLLPSLALALAAMAYLRWSGADKPRLGWIIAVYSAGLFVCCMVCHGELVRRRPPPVRLTTYYLFMALGGALGGGAVGLAAPLLLHSAIELEIALGACALLAIASLYADRSAIERPWLGITSIGYGLALLVFLAISIGDSLGDVHLAVRNFYGSLRVMQGGDAGTRDEYRKLLHGNINHGAQWLHPSRARQPTTYYCPDSGAGLALTQHHADRPRTLGVIGLGAGTLATYAHRGDRLRIYDINPLVIDLAGREFSYVRDARAAGANVQIATGDARLSLEREPPQGFDVLAVDAFSGDAIPVHLLTREAFQLYFRHLQPDGVLAVHISNRHLDLAPVLADAAAAFGRKARVVESEEDEEDGYCFSSTWVLLTASEELFARKAFAGAGKVEPKKGFRAWTDEYSNLVRVLK